ncbi:hypothetical protein CYY_006379 [Polysphondylium violaceum]|uniref:Transmembrane protein n=1 Tax=Polysphondylium violaceum TaxID=133409 RepID=A0A8J4URJ1_9MYCE|nr:hypothetical protein CYY_006379 [Polysphondylium violaceum]
MTLETNTSDSETQHLLSQTNNSHINNNSNFQQSQLPFQQTQPSPTHISYQQQQQQQQPIFQQQYPHVEINPIPTNCSRFEIGVQYNNAIGTFNGFDPHTCDPILLNSMTQDEYREAVLSFNKVIVVHNWIIFIPIVLVGMAIMMVLVSTVSYFFIYPGLFLLVMVTLLLTVFLYRRKKRAINQVVADLNLKYQSRQIKFDVIFKTKKTKSMRKRNPICTIYIYIPIQQVDTYQQSYQTQQSQLYPQQFQPQQVPTYHQ